jgi:hypothetical protein
MLSYDGLVTHVASKGESLILHEFIVVSCLYIRHPCFHGETGMTCMRFVATGYRTALVVIPSQSLSQQVDGTRS